MPMTEIRYCRNFKLNTNCNEYKSYTVVMIARTMNYETLNEGVLEDPFLYGNSSISNLISL